MPLPHIQRILDKLDGVKPTANGHDARCPAHHDRTASLSISAGTRDRAILHCHAGCSVDAIVRAIGVQLSDLHADSVARPERIVATYPYHDVDGTLLFEVIRYDPKTFRPRRPDGVATMDGCKRVLYRLPELIASTDCVLIVGGEKDVDNLRRLGFTATCNPGGEKKWKHLDDDSQLDGRDVVLIADKDTPGRAHVVEVAGLLNGRAKSIKCLELPGAAVKDSSDWIAAGGTALQLRGLIAAATDTLPDPLAVPAPAPPKPLPRWSGSGPYPPEWAEFKILLPKRPLDSARMFRRDHYSNGRELLNVNDSFFGYTPPVYIEVEELQIRQELYRFLEPAKKLVPADDEFQLVPFDPTKSAVDGVIDPLRAEAFAGKLDPPCWIDPTPADPPPSEILTTPAGLFHLPTEKLLPHSPRWFNLNAIRFDYDAAAPAPMNWYMFLIEIFDGDDAAAQLLSEWFGYCLTGGNEHGKILGLIGPPRSGKGTIVAVLTAMLGAHNVASPTLTGLSTQFGLWSLIGKSLATIPDARMSVRTDQAVVVERLLSISGNDYLTIDRKNREAVTIKLPTRLMLVSNELPKLSDSSGALAERFVILQLTKSFLGREDTGLQAKILSELPGILLWAIAGWKSLRARGRFAPPSSSDEALEHLRDLVSPVGSFVREICVIGKDEREYLATMFEAWKRWSGTQGRDHVGTIQSFSRDIHAAAPATKTRRDRDGRFFEGIALNPLLPR